ncbi:MAG: hypothetical protein MJD61_22365 [Proteobacteria bacterium]|nr:hypothetical protein [Pseudomonadota bacterium]
MKLGYLSAPVWVLACMAGCGSGQSDQVPAGPGPGGVQCAGFPPASQLQRSCIRTGAGTPDAWARCGGSLANEDGNAVAVDWMGNVYLGVGMGDSDQSGRDIAAHCWGMSELEYGTVAFDGMSVSTAADEDPGLIKYSRNGDVLWVQSAPGLGGEGEIRGLAVDPVDGSVVAVGDFTGAAEFQPGAPLTSLSRDLFVADYDPTGQVIWSRTAMILPDPDGPDEAEAWGVAIDPTTELITVTGDFRGTMTLGALGPAPIELHARGSKDMFVAQFDKLGNVLWADDVGGMGDESVGWDVTVQTDGSEIVVGVIAGAAPDHVTDRFNNDVVVIPFGGSAGSDMLLVHYAQDGRVLWVTHAGYPGRYTGGQGVGHDAAGNVYVSGQLANCGLFPRIPLRPGVPPPPPAFDPALRQPLCVDTPAAAALEAPGRVSFVAKYLPDGSLSWVKQSGGSFAIEVVDDPVIGQFFYIGHDIVNSVTFGIPPGLVQTVSSVADGVRSHSIAKYDLEGGLQWVKVVGGTGDSGIEDIAADPVDGAVVGTGNMEGTALFPSGETLTSSSGDLYPRDILLYRFAAH